MRLMRIRRYIVAGLLVWVPLGITVFILNLVVGLMDRTLLLLPAAYRPENLIGMKIPGLGILLTFIVVIITGFLAANFVGKSLVGFWERVLDKIPLVRSIYSASKNFTEVLFTEYEPGLQAGAVDRVSAQGGLQPLLSDVDRARGDPGAYQR